MEYSHKSYAIFALIALVFWMLDYWKVFQKPIVILPPGKSKFGFMKMVRLLVFITGVTSFLFMAYSMTGPRKPLKFLPSNIEVNDIFLVVDVSRSMLADDLKPNRLEVAKQKLKEFAALRPTDRIGIVIFSEKVFTLLPLTTDPNLVNEIISDIKIGFLGSGTNIGDALALAVARGQASPTKNKVVILLTDGVNNVGNMTPINAAKTAKEFGIKVYTIGLGTTKSRLPIGKDPFGRQQYQSIPGGSIDVETLEKISSMTGGKSFMADSENSLAQILEEIQKLEKTEIKAKKQVVYEELYLFYLLIGGGLFLFTEIFRRAVMKEVV